VALKSEMRIRPTSYVELEGEIQGGMSGGPCFDSESNVIGAASRGWNFLDDTPSQSPLSYVALLWPAMSIPIDPFKTGVFPAWDLFKAGTARAVGHRRLHVTGRGEVQLGVVDPDGLVALPLSTSKEHLGGALNFCAENARRLLADMQTMMNHAQTGTGPWDANFLHRALRHYFWELNSALRLAMRLAALHAGFALETEVGWEPFVAAWHGHGAEADIFESLESLRFSWFGIDLFEIRTYSALAMEDLLDIRSLSRISGSVSICALQPCRKGGQQVSVPDGLERYYEAARRFTRRLLRLSIRAGSPPKVDPRG
jgi:hypothetical protein